jgi:hypothetical protein
LLVVSFTVGSVLLVVSFTVAAVMIVASVVMGLRDEGDA